MINGSVHKFIKPCDVNDELISQRQAYIPQSLAVVLSYGLFIFSGLFAVYQSLIVVHTTVSVCLPFELLSITVDIGSRPRHISKPLPQQNLCI